MDFKLSIAAARAGCDAISAKVDEASAVGKLIVYSGTVPAATDEALSDQNALVEFELYDPAFSPSVSANGGGHATANPIAPVKAGATGTATFFRIYDGDNKAVGQGDVSDITGNGAMKMSATAILQDIDATVVSLTLTLPA